MIAKAEKENKRLVLLDVHAILHRAYHALPDFSTRGGEPTGGLYGLSAMLIKIIEDLKPDYVAACYDLPGPTHRHEAYEAYKAGRKKAEDDLVMQIIKSRKIFEAFGVPIYDRAGYEADDIIGTIATLCTPMKNMEVVIASGDMDTLQLVSGKKVTVYTLKKGIKDTIVYDESMVKERFGFSPELLVDYKGLRGDPSDNIIGISGIGEKTATELIVNFGSIEEIYKKLKKDEAPFLKAGIKPRIIKLLLDNEEEALFSKALATIKKDVNIDFAIPKKHFKENLSFQKIDELFKELEFKVLRERVKTILFKGEQLGLDIGGYNTTPKEVDEKMLQETKIAFWVFDSNNTNADLAGILEETNTKTLDNAYEKIIKELEKNKTISIFNDIEKPLIPIITKMEKSGIRVDKDYLAKLSKEYHKDLSVIENNIYEMAGEVFNINSPKQLGNILFDRLRITAKGLKKTAGGARSTRESELEKLKDEYPIVKEILKHRTLQKILSTYVDNIPDMVSPDGRLRAKFLQAGTTTGRMSSNNPNLQNIPVNTDDEGRNVRKAFVADDGKKLVALDYSQIELRISALLSKDKKLVDIFKKGVDVHQAVASEVFNVSLDKVTSDMRRQAKIINFGILYGMGVNALRANLGSDRETAQKFYNEYFKEFSGLAEYLEHVKAETYRRGYTETFFGRRRYFPDIKSKLPFIRASAERMAINAPIQGTSADIIKIAMKRVDELILKEGLENKVRLLLQVHDELVFEMDEKIVKEVAPKIEMIMEGVVPREDALGIKFEANIKVGQNWAEMNPLATPKGSS